MSKKKKHRKRKAVKPDDYLSFGPIEVARFGNLNLIRNNSTPEQFDKTHEKLAKRFLEVCQEIDEKISAIVKEVNKYSPTELLKRAYWNMAEQHLNIQSEVEINQEKALSLRMIDYVQSIIIPR
ncbi:MAG: hypothetical protein D3910_06145 [Candidatus Electrothrix sp. ATG2]|nr:hypothetical protein [Candidatus Electrothrix sp. ATG2]